MKNAYPIADTSEFHCWLSEQTGLTIRTDYADKDKPVTYIGNYKDGIDLSAGGWIVIEDDKILIETDSYNLDGTPYIITYTWDRQKNTLSYYNERYDYTYTLYPCEQTDNGLLPYGMDVNHVINGEQMTDFRYQDSSSLLLDAIRTSAVERVSAPMPQSPDYEIHYTCNGKNGVCYVADELFYMDGNAYRLSKMPLALQALRGMNWISNQPLTDAQGRVYYTHLQPEICEVSMWYGENRYYVFNQQAELEEALENIRPYAVEERPDLPMEEMDNSIAVHLSEYTLHVYPCGWVYDSQNDVYFPAEYTAGVCALLEPYRFMVEDFRAASVLQGNWEAVQGGDYAAAMTVYYLSAGNGIGSRTTYYEEGKQTEQFALEAADDRLGFTFADGTRKTYSYALEGSVFVAGAAVQWLRDGLRMVEDAKSTQDYALEVEDTRGMYIVPAFSGLGAPYWNQHARGTIVGVTRGCSKEHFIRATLESIAYQSYSVLKAMEQDAGIDIKTLKVDGGASANDFLMQFQADIMNATVYRPGCIETTALGAAYLAGLAVGYFKDKEEIRENWQLAKDFAPVMEEERRKKLLHGWNKAVQCALCWQEEE